jgi:hypothetical protein
MTPAPRWHPDELELTQYVVAEQSMLAGASVETHLLSCGHCRATVAGAVRSDRLAAVQRRIDDRLDALERPWLERLLCKLGLAEADARVLLSAPSVRLAWGIAVVAAALLSVLVASQQPDGRTVYLLLAPMLPAGATAIAYAPRLDPALSIVSATPYRASRLLLIRSVAVGITAGVAVTLASVAVPDWEATAVVWLLPALALTLALLTLSPWLGTGAAAALVGGAWSSVVFALKRSGLDPLLTYSGTGQLVSAALAALALAVLASRWQRLDDGGLAR